jgi:hypothetical protein
MAIKDKPLSLKEIPDCLFAMRRISIGCGSERVRANFLGLAAQVPAGVEWLNANRTIHTNDQ